MKLLYKGSECGVPCTCPAAEEEYVWWKYADEMTIYKASPTPTTDCRFPTPVRPIGIRAVDPSLIITRLNILLINENTFFLTVALSQNTPTLPLFDGQPIIVYLPAQYVNNSVHIFRLQTYNTTANVILNDVQFLVSKSDYAKLVEASGS